MVAIPTSTISIACSRIISIGLSWSRTTKLATILSFLLAATFLYRHRNKYLWPGLEPDPAFSEPLPKGLFSCPWIGTNFLAGSETLGPEFVQRRASKRLGDPRVWRLYFLGQPIAMFSGKQLVQQINNMEFTITGADVPKEKKKTTSPQIFGNNNLMFETNKERHGFLRQLVGSAMTPLALKGALPTIQQTAENVLERLVMQPMKSTTGSSVVKMENVCVDYTMDIVQNQLLGLKLTQEAAVILRERLKEWTNAFYSVPLEYLRLPWLVKRSKPYKARLYIQSKIDQKIDSLLESGPDTSTLSSMLNAVDEANNSAKLSREEVVENALLLVLAGSETSAGTLTLAMLLLGVNPDKYSKLVQEQENVVKQHGAQLTQAILDKECPYLDAVVKETLRIGPVTGGFPRRVRETFVVDGVQIPKDWLVSTGYRLTHDLDPVAALAGDAHMDVYQGFQPERWHEAETTPSDYVPFGAGPRFCLGYNLAMMEMKVFLAVLARKASSFQLTNYPPVPKHPVKWNPYTIIPRPKDGVLLLSIVERASS
jgi:retinoid hydroxylase